MIYAKIVSKLGDLTVLISVADPDPDPEAPYVFGPPGSASGSFSHRYGSGFGSGSGSESCPSSSKNRKRNLDFYCFVTSLHDFLSLKNDVNVPVFRIRRIRLRLPDPLASGTGRICNTGFYLNSPFIFQKSSTAR